MLRAITIRTRLVALSAIVVTGLMALAAVAAWQRSTSQRYLSETQRIDTLVQAQLEAAALKDRVRGDLYALLMVRSSAAQQRVRSDLSRDLAALRAALARAGSVAEEPTLRRRVAEARAALERYARLAERMAEALSRDRLAAIALLGELQRSHREASAASRALSETLSRWAEAARSRSVARVRWAARLAWFGSLALATVGVAIAVAMVRTVTRSVETVSRKLRLVASGDMTVRFDRKRTDEFGELERHLADSTEAARAALREVGAAVDRVEEASNSIARLADTVDKVTRDQLMGLARATESMHRIESEAAGIRASSSELRESAAQSRDTSATLRQTCTELSGHASSLTSQVDGSLEAVHELAASIREIVAQTKLVSDSASDARAAVEKVARVSHETAESSEAAVELAERAIQAADEGQARVSESLAGVRKMVEVQKVAQARMEGLSERAHEIGRITEVLEGIADATHLLAFNAAIISAQAGQGGRAFQVVASEIRELADRSRGHARQIRELVERVQQETEAVREAVTRSLRVASEESHRSQQAGRALGEIATSTRKSREHAETILAAARAQAELCHQVRELSGALDRGLREIRGAAEQQEQHTHRLVESFEAIGVVAEAVADASERQVQRSEEIAQRAARIDDATARIDEAMGEQSAACTLVGELLEAVREATVDSAARLQQEVQALLEQSRGLRQAFRSFRT